MRSLAPPDARSSAKTSLAAGDLDQLRHPADAGDQRVVPLLEVDARPADRRASRAATSRKPPFEGLRASASALSLAADERAKRPDHRKDAGDVALIEEMDGDARAGSSATIWAWRSENARTRSGSSARIFGDVGRQ